MAEEQRYSPGTGRRKTAIAQVRLYSDGSGITINDRTLEQYFPRLLHQKLVQEPLRVTDSLDKFRVVAKVEGGGIAGQADAVRLGLARALLRTNEGLKPLLKAGHLLTRDPRIKERKKYGLKRARKARQYRKR